MDLRVACIALVGFLSCQSVVMAEGSFRPNANELAMLPLMCQVKFGRNQEQNQAYQNQYGVENWRHLHHYCDALNFVNRARRSLDANDRAYKLGVARNNFEYVIEHTARDFFMRPQVYVETGNVLMQLKKISEAVKMYSDAIAFEPRYVPAYISLIEFYRRNGSPSKALETASNGLRYAPENSYLQTAYLDLGGKKPFPEPASAVAAVKSQPENAAGALAESASSAQEAETQVEVPSSGCRFCPPETVQERWRATFEEDQ